MLCPDSFCQVGAPFPSCPQEGQTAGKQSVQDQTGTDHTSRKNGRAKFPLKTHLASYFVVVLVTEILKVMFKEIWVPKN